MAVISISFRKPPREIAEDPPCCPVHRVIMRVRSVQNGVRYCYCRVEGCRESQKQSRRLITGS